MWLTKTRDYILSFYGAHSRPTCHTMMTRTRKSDVSETDVSSKKKPHRYLKKPGKITISYKGGRYALTASVVTPSFDQLMPVI